MLIHFCDKNYIAIFLAIINKSFQAFQFCFL